MRLLLLLSLLAAGLAACGERDFQAEEGQRRYQGKADGKPWDNEGQWTRGDRASWETHIKSRQLTQHEHKRINQP